MKKIPDSPTAAALRRQAEAKLSERKKKGAALSGAESDTQRLLHELEVHQIELEMQNEELVQSRAEVEAGLRQYTDLYDFAPIGYFTLARDSAIDLVNLAGANLLGVERGALLKRRFGAFVSAGSRSVFNAFLEKVFGSRQKEECEIQLLKDGSIPLCVHIEAIAEDGQREACRVVISDVTERRCAEEKLKSLLKEKEVLIKEVHHRVKNNFTIVSSLLNLQSQLIEDENIKNIFMKSRDRIKSMSLVHERLYQSKCLTHINLSEYIQALATDLHHAYETDRERLDLFIEADDIAVDVDRAIPCGLVLNELISNALKYGFPPGWNGEGRIEVTLRRIHENEIELAVKDNGVGLPDDFDIEKIKSLGLKITILLVEDQLKGKLRIDRNEGTGFFVRFNEE